MDLRFHDNPTTRMQISGGMTPQRWRRIQDVFDEACELPADRRAAFLDTACGADVVLRAEIEALLAADARAGVFLGVPAAERAAPLIACMADDPAEGEQVGPYRLVRALGYGGMGVVYLADRTDGQFEQRVALKLVRGGREAGDLHRRFLAERQILARLQHPHIAPLFDGGVTGQGRPYFVMEYVEGEAVTAYCDRLRLPLRERLRLFEAVCEAVRYAHRSLVVHSDLKPSNMLVTPEGHLKLLDFGIARLLDGAPRPGGVGDAEGLLMLTPAYAAPEQVRGEPVTTATDVYALGVVLYELLTGHRPYAFETRTRAEVARVVCDTTPAPPSTVVQRTRPAPQAGGPRAAAPKAVTPEAVCRARSTSLPALCRTLRGDLDAIVLTALDKAPERRYGSVEALLDDLRRYLDGLPVAVRQPTPAYRLRKFVRRHRYGTAAAAAFGLVLAAFAAFYTVRVTAERDRARLEAAKAAQVKDFVVDLFEVSDPGEARGRTLTAEDLLVRGADRVAVELNAQPAVQAEMLNVLGTVYTKLGAYARADSLLAAALVRLRRLHPGDHADVARALNDLGVVRLKAGTYDAADSLFQAALAMRTRLLGPRHSDVAEALGNVALVATLRGDYAVAAPRYRQALALERAALGPDHPRLAASLNNLAGLLRRTGELDEAEAHYREALALRRRTLGEDHPDVAEGLDNLAGLLRERGVFPAADSLAHAALALRRRVLGPAHPDVARNVHNLATIFYERGDYPAADSLYREALALRRRSLGPEHPDVIANMASLGAIRFQAGDYDGAVAMLDDVLALRRRVLGSDHPDVATTMNNLATIRRQQGDFEAAERLFRDVLVLRRRTLGAAHPSVGMSLYNLGAVLHDQGRYDAAERHYRDALRTVRATLGPVHPNVAAVLSGLAALQRVRGDLAGAEAAYREALALRRAALGDDHPGVANALNNLAAVLTDRGDHAGAEAALREALDVSRRAHGDEHPSVATLLANLGGALRAQDRLAAAAAHYEEGLAMHRRLLGDRHPDVATDLSDLAEIRYRLGDTTAAEAGYRESLSIFRETLPAGHTVTAGVEARLARLLLDRSRPADACPLLRSAEAAYRTAFGAADRRTRDARAALSACR